MAVASERDQRLFAALTALRDARSLAAPALDRHWRVVYAWLEASFPPRRPDDAELAQLTVLRVMDAIGRLEATTPRAAAHWLGTIRKRIGVDAGRVRTRARVRQVGLGSGPDEHEPVDGSPRPDEDGGAAVADARLAAVEQELRDRVGALVDVRTTDERKRAGDRVRADTALARIVRRLGEAEIREALAPAAPPSRDALYKWVERGRELVLGALDVWMAEPGVPAEELDVLGAYREIVGERRADAGRARPARRGPRQSGQALDVHSAESESRHRSPSRREQGRS